ncbi:hypothetical protein FJTKL_02004 [Diaporthe vaccinii]|uniref:Uncharacterized protein n=1 Tax=Diaporthe vaccinii TaxID=105482 RepID=A0ABR4DZ86_9PEZI
MESRQVEVGFLRTEGAEIDPAFGVRSQLNIQRTAFNPKEPLYQLDGALKHYRTLECDSAIGFDAESCSWDDVFRLLSEAKSQYQTKEKGFRGAFVAMARKAGDHADAITPAFQLIPEQYGLGVLRASLCWMFVLLKTAAKKRAKILDAFEDIPRIITTAELKRTHFPHDMVLRDLADGLNDTVVEALTKFIAYLLPKHQVAKIFPAFSKVPSGDDVDAMIEKVEKAVLHMKERSEILSEAVLVDIRGQNEKHHERVQTALNMTRATAVSTSLGLQTVGRQISQIEDTVQPMPHRIETLQRSMAELKEDIARERLSIDELSAMANRGALEAQNWMLLMYTELKRSFDTKLNAMEQKQDRFFLGAAQLLDLERYTSQTPSLLQSSRQLLLEPEKLLAILNIPQEAFTRDLNHAVRQGLHLRPAEQAQAQWLMRMDRFWAWFSSNDSDMLFADGALMDPFQHQFRISSLSVVCATIVAIIAQADSDAFAIHYFCAQHVSSTDTLSGPQGLMRCLTARLLLELQDKYSAGPSLDFLDAISIQKLEHHDVQQLCDLFCHLLMQLQPSTTVYCIIDGICWFERLEMLEDLFKVMQCIFGIVDKPGSRATLKVLLTSPFRSRHLAQGIPAQRRVMIQAESPLLAGPLPTMSFGGPQRGGMVQQQRHCTQSQDEELTIEDYI